MKIKLKSHAVWLTALALSSCSQQHPNLNKLGSANSQTKTYDQTSLVKSTAVSLEDTHRPSVNPGTNTSNSVQVSIVIDRDALLNQEFLYGADLQYSSLFDSSLNLYNQSIAIGHIPARFRIAGNELHLVADNRRLYPSDVNHPEQLLSRYTILAQSDGPNPTLTISGANSRIILAQLFAKSTQGDSDDSTAKVPFNLPNDLWIRSFDFVPQGNYFLQQTSVILSDGTIAEFMESVFPRSTLKPGAKFEKFNLHSEGTSLDPVKRFSDRISDRISDRFSDRFSDRISDRFRMIPSERNFEGENSVRYAQHFDLSPNEDGTEKSIDFYVTPNIPEEDLEPVRQSIEGWNRYFTQFKGIQRKVVQFKGRLPEGIYIGDPRFNVINWDSRRVAGAAYESQAADPSTGNQSHTLIYMPAAWLQLGHDYWEDGKTSDPLPEIKNSKKPARLACFRDLREPLALAASGRLSKDEADIFAVQTVKQTLFHEVGHALGLDHNFKGSLSFDRSNPASVFSTSIMDYNDWEIERAAFYAVDSADGPLLEYDRQALSALYNGGADIQMTDPILPTCNDAEADKEEGGVDPLCVRYDIESDPTRSLRTAFDRMTETELPRDVTLSQALERRGQSDLINSTEIQTIKTKAELNLFTSNLNLALQGSIRYFVLTGKASLAKAVVTNVKSLLQFEEGVLPPNYSELRMRQRAFTAVKDALALSHLPPAVSDAVENVAISALVALRDCPYIQSQRAEAAQIALESVREGIVKAVHDFECDEARGLPKLRANVLAALTRRPNVPFFLGTLGGILGEASEGPQGGIKLDFETSLNRILYEATLDRERTSSERVTAATSLRSYKGRLNSGDRLIKRALHELTQERLKTKDNPSREMVELILSALRD